MKVEDGPQPKCEHTQITHIHATLKVLCLLSKWAFVIPYQETSVSLWKVYSPNPRCVFACMCIFVCMHSQECLFPRTYLSCAVLRAWERWRHSVNDNYDDGVYLSVEVEKGRWGLNECSVRGCRERSASQEERGSEEEGEWGIGVNSSLCGDWEKRESLLWYVYLSE